MKLCEAIDGNVMQERSGENEIKPRERGEENREIL